MLLIRITGPSDKHHFRKIDHGPILGSYFMVMIDHKKKGTAPITQQEQATVKLLPYQRKKTAILPEQDGSKKKRPMPLFYNKPIYKGKKHDFL